MKLMKRIDRLMRAIDAAITVVKFMVALFAALVGFSVVAGLFAYRRLHDPEATLTVVGRPEPAVYASAVRRFVADLELSGAVRFAGRLADADLDACYRDADVLVVASEHEGFCLPVAEAMARGLPVLAFAEGAVPEVVGDAGVLLAAKAPLSTAAAAWRLQTDDDRRGRLVAAGRRRVPELGLADAADRLVDLLVGVQGPVLGR